MSKNDQAAIQTEILIALHNIEDRLQEISNILKLTSKDQIESQQDKVLAGSPLRKQIYDLCDGSKSVSDIAKMLGKPIQQISNNISILQTVGLIGENRKGKVKYYSQR